MKLMPFRCSSCGTQHQIPRALAVVCPVEACKAPAGKRCRDLRSKNPDATRLTVHPEREALLPDEAA